MLGNLFTAVSEIVSRCCAFFRAVKGRVEQEESLYMFSVPRSVSRFNSAARWKRSLREPRSLKVLSFCGVMMALAFVLKTVSTIRIGPYIKIGLSGYPNQIVDYLFGPATGAFFSGGMEFIKFINMPDGVFFPGFTLSAVTAGVIYGFAFYERRITVRRVFCAHLIVKIVVNMGMNTLWLVILTHRAAMVFLPARVLTNIIRLPFDTMISYMILKAVERSDIGLSALKKR